MESAQSSDPAPEPSPERRPATAARWAALSALVLGVAAAFAYAGGWLTPQALTARHIVDTFEQVNGPHPGFRRNHAKGICFKGFFEGNGQGQALSIASVFEPGRVPVVGRFALAGGQPYAADAAATTRSMALQFQLRGGEEWRTGMNDIPVFPVSTPQAFLDMLSASLPDPATGKPNPASMPAFLSHNPASQRALQLIKGAPKAAGFESGTYNSLNAFFFVDARGSRTKVRWSMLPEQPFEPAKAAPQDKNYLFDALRRALEQQPLHFRLVAVIGAAEDPTHDATLPWPATRPRVDLGRLTISQLVNEAHSPARDLNFDPLLLPNGIAGSDDPLLNARSAAYSVSFTRREGEPKQPGATDGQRVAP